MLLFRKLISKAFPKPEPKSLPARVVNYTWYAIGEIVLIVVGIMLAISLNNYNENKKQQQIFIQELEIVYNKLFEIKDLHRNHVFNLDKQENIIDAILADRFFLSYPENQLPYFLYYVDLPHQDWGVQPVSINNYIKDLKPITAKQTEVYNVLLDYIEHKDYNGLMTSTHELNQAIISPDLEALGIPYPALVFGMYALNNFEFFNTMPVFSEDDVNKVKRLLKQPQMITKLHTLKAKKSLLKYPYFMSPVEIDNVSQMIKNYFPSISYQTPKIGIIGSAIEGHGWFETSLDMALINEEQRIFYVRVYLIEGQVKFRADNMWKKDWGGSFFPSGEAILKGDNISVPEGLYDVYFNLTELSYRFEQVEQAPTEQQNNQ